MTIGTGFRTVRLAIFHHGFIGGNHAQAGFTGAFHLSYGRHCSTSSINSEFILTHEQLFRYFLWFFFRIAGVGATR
jgi:hypothetical protein